MISQSRLRPRGTGRPETVEPTCILQRLPRLSQQRQNLTLPLGRWRTVDYLFGTAARSGRAWCIAPLRLLEHRPRAKAPRAGRPSEDGILKIRIPQVDDFGPAVGDIQTDRSVLEVLDPEIASVIALL
jgi:hypothetical protein